MNAQRGWYLAALAVVVASSGCGDSHLLKVTGKVTWKGQPVPSTQVTFMPDDGSRPSNGLTDDKGNFTLRYSRQQAGATRGPCTVFLKYVTSNEEDLHKIPPKASAELKAVITRYGDPKTSGLHFEITKNRQFIPINLD
jgi:hypothetical protein